MPRAKILVIKLPRITKVLGEGCESRNTHRYHVVAQDLATQWLRSYPCSQEIQKSLQSTPHRSETNGIVERAVCRIQEGKSAVLLQSGLYEKLWADSMECFCCLRVGKTPYGRRFGVPFNGPVILLGAMLEYHLISAKVQKSCQVLWKGDVMVQAIEELEQMDASELHARRLNAEEVLTLNKRWKFHFPDRRWNSQNFWKRSVFDNIYLNLGSPRPRRRTWNSSRRIRRVFFQPTSTIIFLW